MQLRRDFIQPFVTSLFSLPESVVAIVSLRRDWLSMFEHMLRTFFSYSQKAYYQRWSFRQNAPPHSYSRRMLRFSATKLGTCFEGGNGWSKCPKSHEGFSMLFMWSRIEQPHPTSLFSYHSNIPLNLRIPPCIPYFQFPFLTYKWEGGEGRRRWRQNWSD